MVAGIPNVGKSTLINSVSGRAMAKTGNKTGGYKGQSMDKVKRSGGAFRHSGYTLAEV